MAVEYGLRQLLGKDNRASVDPLIKKAEQEGKLDNSSAKTLLKLKKCRNRVIRSDIDALAKEIRLRWQRAVLTESGIQPRSDWEEFELVDNIHKEIAIDFETKHQVEELLFEVQRILVTFSHAANTRCSWKLDNRTKEQMKREEAR